jgi:hypothetical protein
MLENKDDWCIVRWHTGELMVRRHYQWYPQALHYRQKWEYVARDMTEKQAMEFKKLFKE